MPAPRFHCSRLAGIIYFAPMIHQLSGCLIAGRSSCTLAIRHGRAAQSALAGLMSAAVALGGCSGQSGSDPEKRNQLDAMQKATIQIGTQPFEVWLAQTDKQRELGLMQVTADQLGVHEPANRREHQRGMLFVFPNEQPLSFWMYNTITPLDIAYIAADGRIIRTYSMAPLETRTYPSVEPAQFALEVKAGLFAELGIAAGQHVEIPDSVLKGGA